MDFSNFTHYLAITLSAVAILFLVVYFSELDNIGLSLVALVVNILAIPFNLMILDSYDD